MRGAAALAPAREPDFAEGGASPRAAAIARAGRGRPADPLLAALLRGAERDAEGRVLAYDRQPMTSTDMTRLAFVLFLPDVPPPPIAWRPRAPLDADEAALAGPGGVVDDVGEPPRPVLPGRRILAEEAGKAGVSVTELLSASRQHRLVLVRHAAMYRLAVETEMSTPQIGRLMHRDHTTVIYGIARHCERHNLPLPRLMTTTIAQRRPVR